MIALLTGLLAFKAPSQVTLDVHGVGYEVLIPLSTYYSLPNQHELVTLSIHTHVREDAIQLFGFMTAAEKEAFLLLTGISGIGPKLGLSVLSTLSVRELSAAIQAGDIEKLGTVSGIGRKSAARIALELKDKLARLQPVGEATEPEAGADSNPLYEDALSALVNLGYKASGCQRHTEENREVRDSGARAEGCDSRGTQRSCQGVMHDDQLSCRMDLDIDRAAQWDLRCADWCYGLWAAGLLMQLKERSPSPFARPADACPDGYATTGVTNAPEICKDGEPTLVQCVPLGGNMLSVCGVPARRGTPRSAIRMCHRVAGPKTAVSCPSVSLRSWDPACPIQIKVG